MKVAHICTAANSHKILVDKLYFLQKKGYEIHIISSKEGFNPNLLENYSFKIHFIPIKRKIVFFADVKAIIMLIKLLRSEKFQIVHTHTSKAGIIGRIAAKLSNTPFIIHTSHGLPFFQGQNKIKYFTYCLLEVIGSFFCDALASQNHEDIKTIRKYMPKKQVYYEGNGINLPLLNNQLNNISEPSLHEIKIAYNILPETKVLLVGARLHPIKNHFFLLDGLKVLKEHYHDDFICLLAGDGPLRKEIETKISQYKLNDHVRILGYQSNIYPLIKLSDMVALTSQKEGIPRIIMESMTFSKPIVATDVLGTRELVKHKLNGFLISDKNPEELAFYLHQLIINEELRNEFGNNGRKFIENNFTESIVADRIHNIYSKHLLKSKGRDATPL